jgi:MFS family permease
VTSTRARAGELRAILAGRDFRRLYATRLISQTTDGVFQVALAGYVFFSPEQQTSPAKAATAFAVLLLPYSLVGPFAGVFIDRWSRRQILFGAPLIRAVLVAGIALLLLGRDGGPAFYLAALLVLGVNRFFLSALSAALPHVVAREHLVLANTISVTSGTVAAFAGAGIGYLLRLVFGGGHDGTALILFCCTAAYVLTSAAATTMGRDRLGPSLEEAPPQTREALGNVVRGLADGARYIGRHRRAALALGTISLHRFLYGIVLIMAGLLYRNTFATSASTGLGHFALFLTVSGAGFLLGAVLTPPAVKRYGKDAWVTGLLVLAAASVPIAGLPFRDLPFTVLGFVLGVVSQGVKLCVDTTVQETVEDAYRGRVFSVYDMLFNTTFVAAAAVAAVSLPQSGRSYAVLIALAVVYVAAAVAYRAAAAVIARAI